MYMHYWNGGWQNGGVMNNPWFINMLIWAAPIIVVLALWTLFWKGLALWHSARRGEQWWFFALLVVNTLGILEIIYLFWVAKIEMNSLFSKHVHHAHKE